MFFYLTSEIVLLAQAALNILLATAWTEQGASEEGELGQKLYRKNCEI